MSANKITYGANCHCGAVQLKFQAPDIETSDVTACNCSICVKNGYHNIYPSPGSVQWVSGYDTLKKYQFNSKGYNHKFCPNCGSSIVIEKADDASQCAVNVSFRFVSHCEAEWYAK